MKFTGMNAMRHSGAALLVGLVFSCCGLLQPVQVQAADETAPVTFDWSTWKRIPVLDGGRKKPLDTFARERVEIISDRQQPTLMYQGKPRKFDPAELLFMWLVEPDKWQDVPFLIAKGPKLREELLEIPKTDEHGEALKYATLNDVFDSPQFQDRVMKLEQARQEAAAKNGQFKAIGIDDEALKLARAAMTFQEIVLDPALDGAGRSRFEELFEKITEHLRTVAKFQELAGGGELAPLFQRTLTAYGQLDKFSQARRINRDELEPVAVEFAAASAALAEGFATLPQRFLDSPPPFIPKDQLESYRVMLVKIAGDLQSVAELAKQLQGACYENTEGLCVVPALNAAALEAYRDEKQSARPWLDLQTLLTGSQEYLVGKGYPWPEVKRVRDRWATVKQAYLAKQPEQFKPAMEEFSDSLRYLGKKLAAPLEAVVQREVKRRDDALLAAIAYPDADYTATEVRYNQLDPFKQSLVIMLGATLAFALAFGVLRKPLFWIGLSILFAGIAMSTYGFFLRISVTQWAPVTNMYETMVYVPYFVSILGSWFLLLPITWEGLRFGWRLTALPMSFEERALEPAENELIGNHPGLPRLISWVLLAPRLALSGLIFWVLTMAPYAADGRSILNLTPSGIRGSQLPGFDPMAWFNLLSLQGNNLLVWAVSLCVLTAAVWFVPRVALTLLGSLVTIPWSLMVHGSTSVNKLYEHPRPLIGLGAALFASLGSLVAVFCPVLEPGFQPLQPVLRDNFWLTIHVLTIVSSYGAGALAWSLGNLALGFYLFGTYRPIGSATANKLGKSSTGPVNLAPLPKRPPEACTALAGYVYKQMQVAVLLLAAGTILGGLWADVSWGRFWGWDPKEVWALISLLVYLAVLHGRYAGMFNNFGLCAGSVLGFTAIVMSWYGVNFVLGAGLHSYGFGPGAEELFTIFSIPVTVNGVVYLSVLGNWIFLAMATARYLKETAGGEHLALPNDGPADGETTESGKREPTAMV